MYIMRYIQSMSTLYVVATPIGNLEDITLRAITVLSSVDIILCEDTRTTRKLLDRYEIPTQTLSYHTHSKVSRTEEIVGFLREGKNLALVSDAGTPGISDPGSELVSHIRRECRAEIDSGEIKIESVPGVSAVITALSIAGVSNSFTFLGFLPHKKGRETLFKEIAAAERTIVFYESPHRILKTLNSLVEHVGGKKRVIVCRELTKVFEQVVDGSAEEVKDYFTINEDKVRGEFTVIVQNLK